MTEESFLLRSLQEVVLVWKGGTSQATFNFTINKGSADLQLGFQLGQAEDLHLHQPQQQKQKGERRQERNRARSQAHHASKLLAAPASSSGSSSLTAAPADPSADPASPSSNKSAGVTTAPPISNLPVASGTPPLEPTHPPPASSCPLARRASTRSTTVYVKVRVAAFARSAAEMALQENLPNFYSWF